MVGGSTGMARRGGRGVVLGAVLMATTAIGLIAPIPATAQTARASQRNFDIPAQSLAQALMIFGRQSGLQVTAEGPLTVGRTSAVVQGDFAPAEALSRLLTGTGLTFRFVGSNGVQLERAPQAADGTISLGPVRVEGSDGRGGAGGGQVTVNDRTVSEGTASYTKRETSFGKGENLKDIPQSVTVMTRQRIEDQGLRTMDQLMEQAPGISVSTGETSRSYYYSRGFTISNFQIDGNSSFSEGWNTEQIDLAIYDSVEILRGSDALYGNSGEPGGAINLVRKKPTRDLQVKGMLSAGSWNNFRGEFDVSGPLALDGGIRGRVVAAYEDKDFFYDVAHSKRVVIYGIIEADLSDSTRLSFGGNYVWDKANYNRFGLPRYSNGDDIGLPRSFFIGSSDDFIRRKRDMQFVRIDQSFGKDWSLGVELSRSHNNSHRQDFLWDAYTRPGIDPVTGAGLASNWGGASYVYPETQKMADILLRGTFHVLGGEHRLKLGANFADMKVPFTAARRSNPLAVSDIFAFDPDAYSSNAPYALFSGQTRKSKNRGIYGSLSIEIADPLTLIGGGRLSWYDYRQTTDSYDLTTGSLTSSSFLRRKDNGVFTPYVGLVYKLTEDWSVYASYADTYQSQATNLKGPLPGTPLDPITGSTYEAGIKGGLLDGRLNTSLAFYSIKRLGQAVRDTSYPNTPGNDSSSCCFLDDGRIVSKGIDAEVSGEILPGWQISGGYTYNDNENKANGNRNSTITPKHLFKLWTSYALSGALDGLKLGGGITAQSRIYVSGSARSRNPLTGAYDGPSVSYQFTEPSRALVNLFGEYRLSENWSASLNLNNVLDKKYYQTVGDTAAGNWYGEPRSFLFTVRASY